MARFAFLLAAVVATVPVAALAQLGPGVVLPPQAGGPPPPSGPQPDVAFAAYQRGYYVTALREAMKSLTANPKNATAMTLIGEIYRAGAGVKPDSIEAEHWYNSPPILATDKRVSHWASCC